MDRPLALLPRGIQGMTRFSIICHGMCHVSWIQKTRLKSATCNTVPQSVATFILRSILPRDL